MQDFPVVTWCCSVFDRRTKKLPLNRQWRILNWSRVPSPLNLKILRVIKASERRDSRVHPEGFEEVVETYTLDAVERLSIEECRGYFDDIAEDDFSSEIQARCGNAGFTTLPFDPEYVEDETGTPISPAEIIECVHGVKDPIVFGNSHSVLRRGIKSPRDCDKWTVQKANQFSQFIEVLEQIARSEWFRLPPRITYVGKKAGPSKLVESQVPNLEKTMTILAFVRQIFADHKQDGLFVSICEFFEEHCGDGGKILWMNERKEAFSRALSSHGLFNLGGKTNLEVLNMFLYGAGLMHAKPHAHFREDGKLAKAIEEHGRERTITAFHFSLHDVMAVPLSTYDVVKREFFYWIEDAAMLKPDRVRLTQLFSSYALSTASTKTASSASPAPSISQKAPK